MERKRILWILTALIMALGWLVLLNTVLHTQTWANAPSMSFVSQPPGHSRGTVASSTASPLHKTGANGTGHRVKPAETLGRHCIGHGPLGDADFCGCTWGEVLFHGQPVAGTVVTLAFGDGITTSVTRLTAEEPEPYFDLTAHDLGARRGDVLTLTAQFAGQAVSRSFRAWPGADGEQHLVLALPERGVWSPWVTGGYTRALALAGDVVWAGGPAGLISVSLTSGVSVVHTLPWPDPSVRALAVGSDGHVWAAGPGGVAEFDGAIWQAHAVPPLGTLRALAVDPTTGAVWLGGGDSEGGMAVYTGVWQTEPALAKPVMALAVDGAGRVWAATWDGGVYRRDGSGGWNPYCTGDGLASNLVWAAAADDDAAWFGTDPYDQSEEGPRGGIARYDLATETWRVYTTAHGLPSDTTFPGAPASIYALALEGSWVWAGTVDGLRFLADGDWWAAYTSTHGLRPGSVKAVVAGGRTVIAAPPAGLDRLDMDAVPGSPPTAQILSVTPPTLTLGLTLTLSGTGWDGDEGGGQVVAWDWSSDRDGPLCTWAACTLPATLLSSGVHAIALRVQDDEGVWSAPVTAPLMVEWRVFLPLVVRDK